LHHVILGEGRPTVVFEAGMGASRGSRGLVAPEVARETTAVVYDRAGLGRSPRDTQPRTLQRAADDLMDLLEILGDGPFVLVGHSYGGPIVRAVAAQRPDLVAGLVLVDQSDEGCPIYFDESTMRQQRLLVTALPWLARLRLARVVTRRTARRLPVGVRAELVDEDATLTAARAFQGEMAHFDEDFARLRDEPLTTPDIPVTLISGTAPARAGGAIREALVASHRERAAVLPQGRHVEAPRSGHLVMFTDPEIVVTEILRLVRDEG
jgi:pimeloyl-ACP methyl ester carboxylesterase